MNSETAAEQISIDELLVTNTLIQISKVLLCAKCVSLSSQQSASKLTTKITIKEQAL
jgi:hypothetical protein